MKRVPYLIGGEQLSQDTIRCLEQLLDEARSGKVIGVSFVALKPRLQYRIHVCGQIWKYRPLVRGLTMDLVDILGDSH